MENFTLDSFVLSKDIYNLQCCLIDFLNFKIQSSVNFPIFCNDSWNEKNRKIWQGLQNTFQKPKALNICICWLGWISSLSSSCIYFSFYVILISLLSLSKLSEIKSNKCKEGNGLHIHNLNEKLTGPCWINFISQEKWIKI